VIYYIDTSALAKKYVLEPGSERLLKFLAEADNLLTSFLTELETLATLERAKRMRRIDSPALRQAIQFFEKEIDLGEIVLIPFDATTHKIAKRLVKQRHLRAPDAIQLATALSLGSLFKERSIFLGADQLLLDAARLEGLRCYDVSA
jgi:hypothetical protein